MDKKDIQIELMKYALERIAEIDDINFNPEKSFAIATEALALAKSALKRINSITPTTK